MCPDCLFADDNPRPPATPNPPRTGSLLLAEPSTVSFRTAGTEASTATLGPSARVVAAHPGCDRDGFPIAPTGYELIDRLGSGGMGDVYLARDVTADRLVAVKFLHAPNNPTAVERFLVEVRALARVSHPHIVRVITHDFYRASPFFVMEYAPGGTLSGRVSRDGPLDPTEAARLVAAVARAVHAAHEADVLHRDLKPSNVLLAADGTIRVSDFGLAKRTDRDDGLTASGPLGTLGYMPPEQAAGRHGEVDRRADVYGLGATLYHLLTGQPPFAGSGPEVLARVLGTPPDRPRSVRPDVPLGLEAVVMKCLEKSPADRYPAADALADDLERFLDGNHDTDALQLTRWRRAWRCAVWHRVRLAIAAGGMLVLAGAFALGGLLREPTGPAKTDSDREFYAPPPGSPVAGLPAPRLSHEQVRDQLRVGGEVLLLDRDGPLMPVVWEVGTCEIVPSKLGDAAFSLRSPGDVVLRLLPDPGLDRYRVRAVVRQDMAMRDAVPAAPLSYSRTGLSVGHDRAASGDRRDIHVLLAAGFCDAAPHRRVLLADRVYVTESLRSVGTRAGNVSERPLGPAPDGWRVIEVDVTPDAVVARVDGEAVSLAVPNVVIARADLKAFELDALRGPRVALPAPSPRRPIGLWASHCWTSVRSVTIRPLP